jgi:hypothetical protein
MTRWIRRLTTVCLMAAVGATLAADPPAKPPLAGRDLVGAWRLVSIDVQGPSGPESDPFYGRGTQGLIIYDAAGWFSVQFMGADRLNVEVPAKRPDPAPGAGAERKAAALDSYYAYYGTWEFDPSTSTVIHHSKGALYPAETGVTYRQRVDIVGSRMTFTRRQGDADHPSVQTKTWEHVPPL